MKKNNKTIFNVLLLSLLLQFGCNNDFQELPCVDLRFDGDKTQHYVGKDVIIKDTSDYIKYSEIFNNQCDSLRLPYVDLNKYSIIGKTIIIDDIGHLLDSKSRLYKNDNNIYTYEIKITHAGFSNNRYLIWKYSMIPKLFPDDSIKVEVVYTRDWFYVD